VNEIEVNELEEDRGLCKENKNLEQAKGLKFRYTFLQKQYLLVKSRK
jgi:hypothetical protein